MLQFYSGILRESKNQHGGKKPIEVKTLGGDETDMPFACPKCHFEQEEGVECLRCGIIFKKYKPLPTPRTSSDVSSTTTPEIPVEQPLRLQVAEAPAGSSQQAEEEESEEFWEPDPDTQESGPRRSPFKTLMRVFPWISLAAVLGAVYLIFQQAPPLNIQVDPRALARVDQKMQQLEFAAQRGQPYTLNLDEAELNAWLKASMNVGGQGPGNRVEGLAPDIQVDDPQFQEAQSSMKDLKVKLEGDQLRAYAVFDFRGRNLSLLLAGRVYVDNGYLRLDPSEAKIGSLPIPKMTLDGVVNRLFESEQNREAFHLPPQISSVDIRHGQLFVAYQ